MQRRNTTEEMVEVLVAFQQGNPIEYIYIDSDEDEDWNDDPDPTFNFEEVAYRVRKKSGSVPYDGTQKLTLVGLVVKVKGTNKSFLITGQDNVSLVVCIDNQWYSYNNLFNHFEYPDGKPCGTLKL